VAGGSASQAPPARLSSRDRLVSGAGALLALAPAWLLSSSWRLELVGGGSRVERLVAAREPVILTCWHNNILACGSFVRRWWLRRGAPVTGLASQSRDGELMARVSRAAGFRVVRGSPSRGGLQSLRRLHRVLTRERSTIGLAPDGSRGPIYEVKTGAVLLAQISGAAILPMGIAADRAWRLKSWDRLIVPKPFARIAIAVGEPLHVPAGLPSERLGAEAARVGEALHSAVATAREGLTGGR